MLREELETAAFWDAVICLDCHETIEADKWVEACPECGSHEVMPAKKVLKCIDVLGEERAS